MGFFPGLQREWNRFLISWTFYTRIPVPFSIQFSPEDLQRSRAYFPLVGLILSCLCATMFGVAAVLLPVAIAVLLSMEFSIWLTGAFHEDGLADSMDALGGGWSREQILAIMKDSRIGTFGTVALILVLGLKFTAGFSLASESVYAYAGTLVFAHTASRYLASWVVEAAPYARDQGSKVKPMASTPLPSKYRLLALTTLCASCLPLIDAPLVILGFLPAALFSLYWVRFLEKWIGGYTGDALGALQQYTELIIYLFAVALTMPENSLDAMLSTKLETMPGNLFESARSLLQTAPGTLLEIAKSLLQ